MTALARTRAAHDEREAAAQHKYIDNMVRGRDRERGRGRGRAGETKKTAGKMDYGRVGI